MILPDKAPGAGRQKRQPNITGFAMFTDGGTPYEHRFFVHYYECDRNLRLSILGVMRYLEEIALMQSESLGVGFSYYTEQHVAWLLSKWDIRMLYAPRYGSTVTVHTQPRGYRHFFANRAYRVMDPVGTLCVEAQSQWVFVDTMRNRPARVHRAISDAYGVQETDTPLPWEADPSQLTRVDTQREFTVRQSDIDHNGHVNNIRYVEWALESLPAERTAGMRLDRLLVHYRKETRYGSDVRCVVQIESDGEGLRALHEIRDGEIVACRLESVWSRAEDVPRAGRAQPST